MVVWGSRDARFLHKKEMMIAGPNQNPIQKFTQIDDIFVSRTTLNGCCKFKAHCWRRMHQSAYIDATHVGDWGGIDLQSYFPIKDSLFDVEIDLRVYP